MSVTPLPSDRESREADKDRRTSLSRPPSRGVTRSPAVAGSRSPAAPVGEMRSASATPADEVEVWHPDLEPLACSPPLVELGVAVVLAEELDGLLLALGHEERPTPKAGERDSSLYYEVEYNGHLIVIGRAPDQGQHRVRDTTRHLLEHYRVPNVVLLGVSGGLDHELKVGDVVVASNVHDLAHRGAMVDSSEGRFVHKLGGQNFDCDRLFVERARTFSELHRPRFEQWQAECAAMFDKVVPDSFRTVCDDFDPDSVFRAHGPSLTVGTIASGCDVGKSHEYKQEILSHNRNMQALDCESAGFMHELEHSPYRSDTKGLILRAISDQATSHKEKLKAMKSKDPLFREPKSRDPLQKLAAYNAGRLLLALLDEHCVHSQLGGMVRELKRREQLVRDAEKAHSLHLEQMKNYLSELSLSLDEPARSHFYVCMPGEGSLCVVYSYDSDNDRVRVQLKSHTQIQSARFDCRPTRVVCCQGSDGKVRLELAIGRRPQQQDAVSPLTELELRRVSRSLLMPQALPCCARPIDVARACGYASTCPSASSSPAISRPATPASASSRPSTPGAASTISRPSTPGAASSSVGWKPPTGGVAGPGSKPATPGGERDKR